MLLGENEESFIEIFKKTDWKEGIYIAAYAWDAVASSMIKNCLEKLLHKNTEKDRSHTNLQITSHTNLQIATEANIKIIKDGPQYKKCSNNTSEWLECNQQNPSLQILLDEEL